MTDSKDTREIATSVDERGLIRKFIVERQDGQHRPGQKHDGCDYFVLDMTHDEHARAAILAYADSCETTRPNLAVDLRERINR